MIKTSTQICKKCKYCAKFSDTRVLCDYILKTGKLRNCNVGECDKFKNEEGNNDKRS